MTLARKLPDTDRHSQAAGIAGLSFFACAAIVPLAYLSSLFRVYAPAVREWLVAVSVASHDWLGIVAGVCRGYA